MKRNARQHGFSLLETLLAVSTLAIGMIFVGGTFLAGIYLATVSTERTIATVATDEALAKIREEEQLKAAELLGVREVIFLRRPDQDLEDTPEFRKELVRLIRVYRPETVITVDPYRRYIWHRDHRITAQVTLDAVFPYARDVHTYPELLQEGSNYGQNQFFLFFR